MQKHLSQSLDSDDEELGTGNGKSKKEAEQEAARHAIDRTKE